MTATVERIEPAPVVVEGKADRRRRIRNGALLALIAAIAVLLAAYTKAGTVTFQLSGQFAENQLPSVGLPALPVAWIGAVYCIAFAALYILRGIKMKWAWVLWALLAILFLLTFLSWAASGKVFPLTNQFQGTMSFATPLILGALAGVLCERSGVINVAIEGQFLVGAFAAAVFSTVTGNAYAGMLAAIVAGVLIAGLLAVFSIRFLVNQVVLGVVLVVFATGITGFLFDQFVQDNASRFNNPEVLTAISIPLLSDIPVIGDVLFRQTVLVYAMYAAVAIVTFVLFKTRWGLRVRAVGEHPRAADTVGINVLRVRYQAVLLGGVFAGLGGAFFTVGFAGSFNKEMTAGNGFIALAALIMGRWHPIGATLAALFFGFATQLQSQLQIIDTPIPGDLLLMAPYLATIIAVAGLVGRVRAPKADGEPYVKS